MFHARLRAALLGCLLVSVSQGALPAGPEGGAAMAPADSAQGRVEKLPAPDRTGTRPLESLMQARLSVRQFAPDTLDARQLGQLLWATCGITQRLGFAHRTVPSAGALYPLELYLLTARGVAHYDPFEHALTWTQRKDHRADLARATLGQKSVQEAPAVIVIAAEPQRTARKYEERAERYVFMEAGFACQNLLLEATALGLGGVPIGAFYDEEVADVLGLPGERRPLLLVPVGRPR